ncbi:MAG: hypothetical protein KUG81_09220 [Gammaproteobacteria bacterium]|nr:hypothetical protein [Gammaproteobacteria bacterium]
MATPLILAGFSFITVVVGFGVAIVNSDKIGTISEKDSTLVILVLILAVFLLASLMLVLTFFCAYQDRKNTKDELKKLYNIASKEKTIKILRRKMSNLKPSGSDEENEL